MIVRRPYMASNAKALALRFSPIAALQSAELRASLLRFIRCGIYGRKGYELTGGKTSRIASR